MSTFREDLDRAISYHGHLCSGQIIGVRMARAGVEYLAIHDPLTYRDLIVYIENDRCIADAIGTVTGCTIGKRKLKCFDYGKSAATFLDIKTGNAVRISSKKYIYPPEGEDLIVFFESLSDEEIFNIQPVEVAIKAEDLPGPPLYIAECEKCGETVLDGRAITIDKHIFCKSCHQDTYYKLK